MAHAGKYRWAVVISFCFGIGPLEPHPCVSSRTLYGCTDFCADTEGLLYPYRNNHSSRRTKVMLESGSVALTHVTPT